MLQLAAVFLGAFLLAVCFAVLFLVLCLLDLAFVEWVVGAGFAVSVPCAKEEPAARANAAAMMEMAMRFMAMSVGVKKRLVQRA